MKSHETSHEKSHTVRRRREMCHETSKGKSHNETPFFSSHEALWDLRETSPQDITRADETCWVARRVMRRVMGNLTRDLNLPPPPRDR